MDFSNWIDYDGMPEGSGRSEKRWLMNPASSQIGLFKFPKSDETKEYVSEKLAYEIGSILGIRCAKVDIGEYKNRIGCMSYKINTEDEILVEGIQLISGEYVDYDIELLYDKCKKEYYSLEMILKSIHNYNIEEDIFKMLIFDFLIGNTDRHQNNWAIILSKNNPCMSPFYDNGSSLCCYITEGAIDSYLGKDTLRFKSLVDTKSRSRIRIDKLNKKEPTHKDMLIYLRNNYYDFVVGIVNNIKNTLTIKKIEELINSYPTELLSHKRKQLLIKFIIEKIEIMKNLF